LEEFLSVCYNTLEESSVVWAGRRPCGTTARSIRRVRHALAWKGNLATEGESIFSHLCWF